jgi:hypothetical protein
MKTLLPIIIYMSTCVVDGHAYTIHGGQGARHCSELTELLSHDRFVGSKSRDRDNNTYFELLTWVQGYITGVNHHREAFRGFKDEVGTETIGTIIESVKDYCLKHPTDPIAWGVELAIWDDGKAKAEFKLRDKPFTLPTGTYFPPPPPLIGPPLGR